VIVVVVYSIEHVEAHSSKVTCYGLSDGGARGGIFLPTEIVSNNEWLWKWEK